LQTTLCDGYSYSSSTSFVSDGLGNSKFVKVVDGGQGKRMVMVGGTPGAGRLNIFRNRANRGLAMMGRHLIGNAGGFTKFNTFGAAGRPFSIKMRNRRSPFRARPFGRHSAFDAFKTADRLLDFITTAAFGNDFF
jgi:hypothetical protein